MIKVFSFVFALLMSFHSFAGISSDEALNFLANKTIEDFQKGVELYNSKKAPDSPIITKTSKDLYQFKVNKETVEFSIVNFLRDQFYINGKLIQKNSIGLNKTTWLDIFVDKSYADDEVVSLLSGANTKVILASLASLSGTLEEVGYICFSSCSKKVRENNLKKIMVALDKYKTECEAGVEAQENSIYKFAGSKQVKDLHKLTSPEFQSVKQLFAKVAATNKKSIDAFMKDHLGMKENYTSCVGVMTVGTVADGTYDSMKRGAAVIKGGGLGQIKIQEMLESANRTCLKMEELKTCLITAKDNLATINSLKRIEKGRSGQTSIEESLPKVDSLAR